MRANLMDAGSLSGMTANRRERGAPDLLGWKVGAYYLKNEIISA
jgi:hypothetical protein